MRLVMWEKCSCASFEEGRSVVTRRRCEPGTGAYPRPSTQLTLTTVGLTAHVGEMSLSREGPECSLWRTTLREREQHAPVCFIPVERDALHDHDTALLNLTCEGGVLYASAVGSISNLERTVTMVFAGRSLGWNEIGRAERSSSAGAKGQTTSSASRCIGSGDRVEIHCNEGYER